MKIDIRNHSAMVGIEEVAKDLYKFAHEKLKFNKPCTIVFESQGDRAVDIFSPTGHYKPATRTVTVYVDHRHPKDILRSMAHELIHHAQHCNGQFDHSVDTSPGYAQKDQHMREMEKDAYFRGNITLFRDWEDNYKKGRYIMEEGKKAKKDYDGDGKIESSKDEYLGSRDKAIKKAMAEEESVEEAHCGKRDEEVDEVKHDCANHVKENATGREGFPINHTLLEDGTVTHYTVEFQNEIVENIPVEQLTILEMNEHKHPSKRDDYKHNKKKPRRVSEDYGADYEAHIVRRLENPELAIKDPFTDQDLRSLSDSNPELAAKVDAAVKADPRKMISHLEKVKKARGLEEEQKTSDKEWYQNQLNEALLRKFKIKK